MNLATDEFRLQPQLSHPQAENRFAPGGDLYSRLSESDCREFLNAIAESMTDRERLYRCVTEFTQKMLADRGRADTQQASNRAQQR